MSVIDCILAANISSGMDVTSGMEDSASREEADMGAPWKGDHWTADPGEAAAQYPDT